MNKLLTKVQKA